MGTPGPQKATSRERLVLAGLLLLALALRVAVIFEQRDDILFQHPIVDEEVYVDQGRALAHGKAYSKEAYWQPPGIAYALSLVFRAAGPGLLWPRLVQALLSTLACWLGFAIARRNLSARWALGCTAVMALHGVLVFSASELMPPTWAMTLDLLALWLALRAREHDSLPSALGAALTLGVSIVFVPTGLLLAPVFLVWLAGMARGRRRLLVIAGCIVALAAPIVPVTLRNLRVSGEVVLVSANGGVNFHLGNNADYPATLEVRPGRRWLEVVEEPLRKGIRKLGAKSSYFYRKALAFAAKNPGRELGLAGRKLALFFNGAEIPRDSDIYQARQESVVLAVLVAPRTLPLPDALILPLALMGLALAWPRRGSWLLGAFVAVQAVGVAAFFVTSRYRIPSLPVLIVFAAVGLSRLLEFVRGKGRARWAAPLVLAGLLVCCNFPWRETRMSFAAELNFYRGLASLRHRRAPVAAERAFAAAAARVPSDPRYWFELGNVRAEQGRSDGAIAAWTRSAEADSWDVRPRRRIAFTLARRGDLEGAARELRANLASQQRPPADYAHEHFNLGQLDVQQGRTTDGVAAFRRAFELDPEYVRRQAPGYLASFIEDPALSEPRFWLALGDLMQELPESRLAMQAWRRGRAAAVEPELVRQLDERLASAGARSSTPP